MIPSDQTGLFRQRLRYPLLTCHRVISTYYAVFCQELGLIHTRQRWIAEQMERLDQQLADIQRYSFTPERIGKLRERLEARLEAATPQNRRFILEAVGATVVAHADGRWELE